MAATIDYINSLKQDKTNLVNNLVEKGVEATEDETFTSLVPKVLEIQSGGGDISEYISNTASAGDSQTTGIGKSLLKLPKLTITGTTCAYLFRGCNHLTEIEGITCDNTVTGANYMFNGCELLESVDFLADIDFSNVTGMGYMFYNCKKIKEIPQINTSKVTAWQYTFSSCSSLETIPKLDASSVSTVLSAFGACSALIDLGGFENLGKNFSTTQSANYQNYTLTLSASTKLTEQSIINVLENLYDIATAGCNPQKCTFGSKNLAKLTSEAGQAALAQATAYGWTVA